MEPLHGCPLYFWTYAFYVIKFFEYGDTVLVLLRRARVVHLNLQIYHHAFVLVMIWSWLQHHMSLQFIGVLSNSFVHVLMYAYYALSVRKVPVPANWKRQLTCLQIAQFSLMLPFGIAFVGKEMMGCNCAGVWTALVSLAFNLTLLQLFCKVSDQSSSHSAVPTVPPEEPEQK